MNKGLCIVVFGLYAALVEPDYSRAQQQIDESSQPPIIYVRSVDDILMGKGLTLICDNANEALNGSVVLFLYDKSEKSKSLAEILAKVIEEHADSRKVKLLIAGEDCMAYGALMDNYKLHAPLIVMVKDGEVKFQTPPWWEPVFDARRVSDRARHVGRSIAPYLLEK